ncbi:MAG: hypothetical protein K9K65_12800 [Desulfarculaceae bacterium]|nr:hypothetical protein [Desulfarculaceae bacterium]MCF8047065.1 hypothetical protein [Desulfarculaceae bacterium]MCF8065237.1 hypothetical protein [Desulfarculaceae bacterium]MCF8098711.1 hypothetical protein [Desulfarculaceae bacterium]MCF8123941.1 hypothetical protein [Desulfarculaceae bacterium]
MGGDFHTNYREENLISRLESSRQSAWTRQLMQLGDCVDELAQKLAMKLVSANLIETKSQRDVEEQLAGSLGSLLNAEDFDIQYAIANFRNLVPQANRISLYVTAFIIERLIDHRSVVDIYGTDEEIYAVVNHEVMGMIR